MRIWTLHPQYLDTKGLLAAWREGLLAQKVLRGETRGYTRHPQLRRLQAQKFPVGTVANYLRGIAKEAGARGYKFDLAKISEGGRNLKLIETRGQLLYEWSHLKRKLRTRSPKLYRAWCKIDIPRAHPLFRIVSGPIAEWEKGIVPKRKSTRVVDSSGGHGRNVSAHS
jgi:hypothetical protein